MAFHHLITAILAAAVYPGPRHQENTPWEVLYIAVGLIVVVLIPVSIASYLNGRDDRDHEV